jgi:subfamily B ATP-binding cassette protein MsbA
MPDPNTSFLRKFRTQWQPYLELLSTGIPQPASAGCGMPVQIILNHYNQPHHPDQLLQKTCCLTSGGQQQRLSIARALLKNAPILLLDEATSALDSKSERMIQSGLEKLAEGKTVIASAHRLSTVLSSDMILVMEQGQVAATGSHAELLVKSEIYRKIYEMQFGRSDYAANTG